jgi:hypothetical protein
VILGLSTYAKLAARSQFPPPDFLRSSFGLPSVFLRSSFGLPSVFLRSSFGLPSVFLAAAGWQRAEGITSFETHYL